MVVVEVLVVAAAEEEEDEVIMVVLSVDETCTAVTEEVSFTCWPPAG